MRSSAVAQRGASGAAVQRGALLSARGPVAVQWAAVYVSATLIIWAISPFIRRLMDWKAHFSAISPIAALPLLMLVPAVAMFFAGRARRVSKSLEVVAILWLLGFSYALVISLLAGRVSGGVYSFVSFCLPLGFGVWIATRVEDAGFWYRRISQTAIILAIATGVYGIVQYVVLPPWDAAWMRGAQLLSAGPPLPFKVRVFSMLNSPGPFGDFLTAATIMFLPRLNLKSGLLLFPVFIGLGLSLVRADWLTLPICIAVYALLTTRRRDVIKGVSVFILAGVLAVIVSQALLSVSVGGALLGRLSSFTNIEGDASLGSRTSQIAEAFNESIDDPEGSGLGVVGVATRLNSAQEGVTILDSGYLSRFLEMGLPGGLAILASLAFAMFAAIRAWRTAVHNGDEVGQNLAAVAISMQVALLMLNLFTDDSFGLLAIFSWTTLGLVLRSPVRKRSSL